MADPIIDDRIYCAIGSPATRRSLYRVAKADALDVRTHRSVVVVLGIDGYDAGKWFTMTPSEFQRRFQLLAGDAPEERPAG